MRVFAEEIWIELKQKAIPESVESDQRKRMGTRRRGRKKASMTCNRYRDDVLIDNTKPDEVDAELVGVVELVPDQEWQIIIDDESFWQKNHSVPEREKDLEQCVAEKKEQSILRILEWMYDLPSC